MTILLEGKQVAAALKEKIGQEALILREQGVIPAMAIIRVGRRPDDIYYENNIVRNCELVGTFAQKYTLDDNIETDSFLYLLNKINQNTNIHGIMIFRPLPLNIDEKIISRNIEPNKDIDCMNPITFAKIFEGEKDGFMPCTAGAVLEMLKYYDIQIGGANVTIAGRSMVVGKPLNYLLLKENATVTLCHSKTKNLREITSKADIVITAVGKAKMFDGTYFNESTVVIDAGINDAGNGNICGDVDYPRVNRTVRAITPVPGGIGAITIAILLKQLILASQQQLGG